MGVCVCVRERGCVDVFEKGRVGGERRRGGGERRGEKEERGEGGEMRGALAGCPWRTLITYFPNIRLMERHALPPTGPPSVSDACL